MQVHVAQFALQYVKCEHTKLTDIPSRVTDSRSCDVIATSPSIGCRDAKKAHDDNRSTKTFRWLRHYQEYLSCLRSGSYVRTVVCYWGPSFRSVRTTRTCYRSSKRHSLVWRMCGSGIVPQLYGIDRRNHQQTVRKISCWIRSIVHEVDEKIAEKLSVAKKSKLS